MRTIGKLLSLLLALALCLTLALPALAEEPESTAPEAAEETLPAEEPSEAPSADPAEVEPAADAAVLPEETAGPALPEAELPALTPLPAPLPANDGAGESGLALLARALRYLVGLVGAERPETGEVRSLGSALALAVAALLEADPAQSPTPSPSPTPTPTPSPTPAPEKTLIAVVPDANVVEDNSLNEAAFDAVQAWAEAHEGYDAAAYTPTEQELEADDAPTYLAIKRACAAGADIVVCTGFSHMGSVEKAAAEYPDVRFLWLDETFEDASLTNVAAVTFAVEQSGYAAGYAAVKEGYTKLGFIGGFPIPDVCLYGYGFVQGAHDAAEELGITVSMRYDYCNDFAPNDTAFNMADGWYRSGTEVIFAAAGGANKSVGEATDENGAKMIGVDVAPGEDFPGILTSAIKDVYNASQLLLDAIDEGRWSEFGGKTAHWGAADGVELLPGPAWTMTVFTVDDYNKLFGEIANGSRAVDTAYPEDITTMADEHLVFDAGEQSAEELVDEAFIDPMSEWAQYDELIDAIRAETDKAKRTAMMHEAEDILMASGGVVPLYYYTDKYLQKGSVTGIYSNPYGYKWFMYAKRADGGDTLQVNLASAPDSMDPALTNSVDGACLAANSYSGLYTYNADGVCVPACAQSAAVSADGRTWTVTLREGLKWSDGSDLTAADFVYSWKRAAQEAVYGYLFEIFEGFDGDLNVSAPDARTLQFTLTAPCGYMEDLMAFPTFYPVKEGAAAGFVTNGAYVCTTKSGTWLKYEKNPYWYDADSVGVTKLNYRLSDDGDAMYAAYRNGELDFLDNVPGSLDDDTPASELHVQFALGTYYAAFNVKSPLFEGKTPAEAACMRKAISLLIDRTAICGIIGGVAPAGAFVPNGMADGSGGIFRSAGDYYDPLAASDTRTAEAMKLLEAAGYRFGEDGKLSDETPLKLTYLTNNGAGHESIANAIRADLAAIGVEMTVKTGDWSETNPLIDAGDFDLCRQGWIADYNDPIGMLDMWTTGSGNNVCRFGG